MPIHWSAPSAPDTACEQYGHLSSEGCCTCGCVCDWLSTFFDCPVIGPSSSSILLSFTFVSSVGVIWRMLVDFFTCAAVRVDLAESETSLLLLFLDRVCAGVAWVTLVGSLLEEATASSLWPAQTIHGPTFETHAQIHRTPTNLSRATSNKLLHQPQQEAWGRTRITSLHYIGAHARLLQKARTYSLF